LSAPLTGTFIRNQRGQKGLTQAALAAAVGISAPYLNLIEHNRRRAGPRILGKIAAALGTDADALRAGGNPALISGLRDIAAAGRTGTVTADGADALVSQYPDWAELVLSLDRQVRDQGQTISALADRMTHDPFLAENIHAMLSNITAIRSTASILTRMTDIPDAQRRQFHAGIHDESLRLSEAASGIADYLGNAATMPGEAVTAEEALDRFLTAANYCFEDLDREAEILARDTGPDAHGRLDGLVADILDQAQPRLEGSARHLAEAHLAQYAADACQMPLGRFLDDARKCQFDPFALSAQFGQPIHAVCRRLAVLGRPGIDAPAFGLIAVTASGYPLFRKPLPDFALPRHGNACPLWPLYLALSRPGQALIADVEHVGGTLFKTLAIAAPRGQPKLGGQPDFVASMLILPEAVRAWSPDPVGAAVPIGTSCRICARDTCEARVEPYLLGNAANENP